MSKINVKTTDMDENKRPRPRKRTVVLIVAIIITFVLASYLTSYYLNEKQIKVYVFNPMILNDTVDVYVDDGRCFHMFYSNDTIRRPQPNVDMAVTQVDGIRFDLRIVERHDNAMAKSTMWINSGNEVEVSYSSGHFVISQFSGSPHLR